MVSHAGVSPLPSAEASHPLSDVPSFPSCLALGPRAEASTLTSSGSPTMPPLLDLPGSSSPALESFVFLAALDSSTLAALAQQV